MKTFDYFEFRSFFMNEIASYLDSFKSDLFFDIATFGRLRSNKTVYFFMRKTGTHLMFNKKDIKTYFGFNERGFKFDFIIDKSKPSWAKIVAVNVLELNKEDYK